MRFCYQHNRGMTQRNASKALPPLQGMPGDPTSGHRRRPLKARFAHSKTASAFGRPVDTSETKRIDEAPHAAGPFGNPAPTGRSPEPPPPHSARSDPLSSPKPPEPPPRILSRAEVLKRLSLSTSTLWRMRRRNEFPPPIQISPNRVGWLESVVSGWIENRGRSDG